jgi:DNA-binding LytR/AlgR family response regulator
MDNMIKVLVVEDNAIVAEDIAAKLRKHDLTVTGICSSGEEAVEAAQIDPPDLVLMDIKLSGRIDGITSATIIKKAKDLPIIYLSDFTDNKTIERAKKTFPENYLSKPFAEVELIRAIDLAFHNFSHRGSPKQESPEFIFLRTDSQAYVKITVGEILFLEAERAYCKVVCKTKAYTMSTSMNHVYDQISSPDFIKVHRSFIININNIQQFEGNMVKVGGTEITMNKEGKEALAARLKFIK